MFGEQDYAEGMPPRRRTPKTLEGRKEAWETAHWKSGHIEKGTKDEHLKKLDKEAQAALVYITALEARVKELEQRNKLLESFINTVHGDIEARPETLIELGHENGLNMLQWLNNAWRFDIQDGKGGDRPGVRHFVGADISCLIELSNRGYVSIVNSDCWVRDAGREYLKALKHELRK